MQRMRSWLNRVFKRSRGRGNISFSCPMGGASAKCFHLAERSISTILWDIFVFYLHVDRRGNWGLKKLSRSGLHSLEEIELGIKHRSAWFWRWSLCFSSWPLTVRVLDINLTAIRPTTNQNNYAANESLLPTFPNTSILRSPPKIWSTLSNLILNLPWELYPIMRKTCISILLMETLHLMANLAYMTPRAGLSCNTPSFPWQN